MPQPPSSAPGSSSSPGTSSTPGSSLVVPEFPSTTIIDIIIGIATVALVLTEKRLKKNKVASKDIVLTIN